jgi:N-acyl-D-aspartate/D-glutamate deacylase
MQSISRTEAVPFAAMQAGMPWDWITVPEFIDSVNRTPKSINVALNVPLNPLMTWVMGFDRAKSGVLPTDDEHREMARLLDEALDAGAIGISAQRLGDGSVQPDFDGTPMPTDVMHDETMFALADVLRKRNEGFIQYTYADFVACLTQNDSRFADAQKARDHVEDVARRSGRAILLLPLHVDGGLDWVRECQQKGLRIHAQRLTAGIRTQPLPLNLSEAPGIFDLYEAWRAATVGTVSEVKEKLNDPNVRARIRTCFAPLPLRDWLLSEGKSPATARFSGIELGKIAEMLGGKDLTDTFLDICTADDLRSDWVILLEKRDLEPLRSIVGDHYWIPGISDGGAHTKYATAAHYGTLFLMSYARDHRWISLEDAHYRLSALPANIAGMDGGVGSLTVGAPADIVVYDLDRLDITAAEKIRDYPAGEWRLVDRSIGYRWIILNGEITMDNGQETFCRSGRVVHSSQYVRKLGRSN